MGRWPDVEASETRQIPPVTPGCTHHILGVKIELLAANHLKSPSEDPTVGKKGRKKKAKKTPTAQLKLQMFKQPHSEIKK